MTVELVEEFFGQLCCVKVDRPAFARFKHWRVTYQEAAGLQASKIPGERGLRKLFVAVFLQPCQNVPSSERFIQCQAAQQDLESARV